MSDLPQDAIDAATGDVMMLMFHRYGARASEETRQQARALAAEALAAAVPFLRQQWEQELLSDEAVERVHSLVNGGVTLSGDLARRILRAALDQREEGT